MEIHSNSISWLPFPTSWTDLRSFCYDESITDVVRLFDDRISIDRIKHAFSNPQVVETVIERVGVLSRYIEDHSPSDKSALATIFQKFQLNPNQHYNDRHSK